MPSILPSCTAPRIKFARISSQGLARATDLGVPTRGVRPPPATQEIVELSAQRMNSSSGQFQCGHAPARAPFHVPATAAVRHVTSVSTTTSATATIGLPGQHCKHRKPFKCTACFSRQAQRPVFCSQTSLSFETHSSFAIRWEANSMPER